VVGEGVYRRTAQPRAASDAAVGEAVDEDRIVATDQRRDDPGVGEITRAEHASRLGLLEAGKSRFEFGVERMMAGDQAGSARARAMAFDGVDRCALHSRVLAQVEVVVAAERQQPPALALYPNRVLAGALGQRTQKRAGSEACELPRGVL